MVSKYSILASIFLAIGFVILLVSLYAAIPKTPPNENRTPLPTFIPIITSINTYRNEKYGIEFKYPISWITNELDENKVALKQMNKTYGLEGSVVEYPIRIYFT